MNANMKSDLSLADLLGPIQQGEGADLFFEFLSSPDCMDTILLASPPQILHMAHLIQAGVDHTFPGSVVIMKPQDMDVLADAHGDACQFIKGVFENKAACLIMSDGGDLPEYLVSFCRTQIIPLMRVRVSARILIDNLLEMFHIRTASNRVVHGNMVDVFGLGILIVGASGIGKSECCLDLITKGHRLIADDSVRLFKNRHGRISCTAAKAFAADWMEIRGVGIIDIDLLYGVSALRKEKDLDLVIELMEWDDWRKDVKQDGYERLSPGDLDRFDSAAQGEGIGDRTRLAQTQLSIEYFGVHVPLVRIPVGPGRSIANLIEVSARKQLLVLSSRHAGKNPNNRGEIT